MILLLYISFVSILLVASLFYMSEFLFRAGGAHRASRSQPVIDHTEFLGCQVGGESVISYCYTDMPWRLVMWDIKYFFKFSWALPWIIWPIRPCDGGDFDELFFNGPNVRCLLLHVLLIFLQLLFLLSLPVAFLLPVWMASLGVGAFLVLNNFLCRGLNGKDITYMSDPKYAPAVEEHAHEQWIFLNGVAVGETWLMANINRLALTFRRPVIGVHNRTKGILFDVIECMVQRNFGYATKDVRVAYKIVKEKLYNSHYTKVVFILHSQGGIEGGLVLDWLLQELPQDLLSKLEVYTFGNAANHFNNPHRHVMSQQAQRRDPAKSGSLPVQITEAPLSGSPTATRAPLWRSQMTNGEGSTAQPQAFGESSMIYMPTASDRALAHVEHFCHTTDFVALWGILHFVSNEVSNPEMPRFIGRVFSRTSSRGGHQFCQHYLDGMFPLARDENGMFTGCADTNKFMDSIVEIAKKGTECEDMREGAEVNWSMLELAGQSSDDIKNEVAVHGSFYEKDRIKAGEVRVKDLSRLWQYRNGRVPQDTPREGL